MNLHIKFQLLSCYTSKLTVPKFSFPNLKLTIDAWLTQWKLMIDMLTYEDMTSTISKLPLPWGDDRIPQKFNQVHTRTCVPSFWVIAVLVIEVWCKRQVVLIDRNQKTIKYLDLDNLHLQSVLNNLQTQTWLKLTPNHTGLHISEL